MRNIMELSIKKLDDEIYYYRHMHNDDHPYLIMNKDTAYALKTATECVFDIKALDNKHCSLYQGCPIAICDSVKYGYVEVR